MKGVNNFLIRSQAVGPKERPGRIRIPGQAPVLKSNAMKGYTVAEARGYTDNYLLDLIRQSESPVLRAEAKRRGLL